MDEIITREKETNHIKKHHKDTFDKISEKKRMRILKIATSEFALRGFNRANINVIAKKAGISIGSMYNYFSTKEHLFLTVVDEGYSILEKALVDTDLEGRDIFDRLEKLIRFAQKFSREHAEFVQLYQDISSEQLSHLSKRLSRKIENVSAQFYRKELEEAKKAGLVDPGLDEHVTSYCIDNIIVLMQFSYTSDYYMERLRTFIGDDAFDDDERIIQGMMTFIRGALSPGKKTAAPQRGGNGENEKS